MKYNISLRIMLIIDLNSDYNLILDVVDEIKKLFPRVEVIVLNRFFNGIISSFKDSDKKQILCTTEEIYEKFKTEINEINDSFQVILTKRNFPGQNSKNIIKISTDDIMKIVAEFIRVICSINAEVHYSNNQSYIA